MDRDRRGDIVGSARLRADLAHRKGDEFQIVQRERPAELGRALVQRQRGVGADDRAHRRSGINGQAWRLLFDAMAEAFEQRSNLAGRGGHFGIDRRSIGMAIGESDAQSPRLARDFFEEGALRSRRSIRAADLGSLRRVKQRRAVAHADADRMRGGKSRPAFHSVGTQGRSPSRRFEAKDAAASGRSADRATAVGRMGDRQNSRSDDGGGAAGGAAGRTLGVPGIASGTVNDRLGGEGEPEFRGRRLAEDDKTCPQMPLNQRRRMIGEIILKGPRAKGRSRAGEQREVLEQEGNAAERTLGQAARDLLAGELLVPDRNRVDLRFDGVETRDRFVEKFGWRDLTFAHEFGEADGVEIVVFFQARHALLPKARPAWRAAGSFPRCHIGGRAFSQAAWPRWPIGRPAIGRPSPQEAQACSNPFSSPIAAKSPVASFGRRRRWGSGRSPSTPPPIAVPPSRAKPTKPMKSGRRRPPKATSTAARSSRSPKTSAPPRSIPATDFCPRMRNLLKAAPRPGSSSSARRLRPSAPLA